MKTINYRSFNKLPNIFEHILAMLRMAANYDGLSIERPGHSTIRIETNDESIMYLDPWIKVLDDESHDADIVVVSHDDGDHYDPEGINAVSKADTIVVAYDKINTSELEQKVVHLPYEGEVSVNNIGFRSVPAYNLPDGAHIRPNGEPYHPKGTVVGIILDINNITVYYCSDTDALDELFEIDADIVIPPIGGRPTMDRHEAAELMKHIKPSLVIPVHYNSDLVDDIEADEKAFKEELESEGIRVSII